MFYPRHTPSNDREQYPIFDSGAMRYGPSTIITGSYADWRKAPLSGGDRSCTSALGRVSTVAERPLCDSRYGKLHAGNLPFIKESVHFALRLAGLGMSRLGGEVRRTGTSHTYPCPQHLPTCLSVRSRTHVTKTSPPSRNQMVQGQTCPYDPRFRKASRTSLPCLFNPIQANPNNGLNDSAILAGVG